LWDSLLRGYPTGAITLSPQRNNKSIFSLLDGQQRSTSIALAQVDLMAKVDNTEKNDVLNASSEHIRLFVDLEKPDFENDNRKYYIRVITRSHPWGYQKKDNTKTLKTDSIRDGLANWYHVTDHLEEPLEKFYPCDAKCPLPLNIFANSNKSDLKRNLLDYINDHYKNYKDDCVDMIENTPDELYSITEIYDAVKNALEKPSIPALYLELSLDEDTKNSMAINRKSKKSDNDDKESAEIIQNPQNDEVEELFIRLNAAGTPLGGEELNYSLLKSCIDPSLQKDIEESCKYIMKPARLITIMYRLYQNTTDGESSESLQMKIKPKQFQKAIRSNGQTFIKFLEQIVKENSKENLYDGKKLLDYFRVILEFGQPMSHFRENADDYRLPNLLVSKIAKSAPELILLLLYRIYKNEDRFTFDTSAHRKMIGIMLLFMWLSDTSKSIQNIWKVVKFNLQTAEFWSDLLVASAGYTLAEFPDNDQYLKELSEKNLDRKDFNLWNKWDWGEHDYYKFYDVIFWEKDVLLYAQRKFLSYWFKQEQFHLDDTNRPFDFDHISAKKLARGSAEVIKNIYESNGNYRAWPYSLNRSDKDDTPSVKFSTESTEDLIPFLKQEVLQKFDIQDTTPEDIKKFFLVSSFCEKQKWEECDATNFQDLGNCRKLYPLIIGRLYDLYNELRKNLLFDELHVKSDIVSFDCVLNINQWSDSLKKKIDEKNIKYLRAFDDLFFYYQTGEDDDKAVNFGLVEISDKEEPHYWDEKGHDNSKYILGNGEGVFWLYSCDSLPCHHEEAYRQFLKDFMNWVEKAPLKNISKNDMIANFKKGLA
jgi:hypothetical protein